MVVDVRQKALLRRVILAALLFSGIASVSNQVVWQRGLKVFLGGSEALSAMIVVLVFMLGLGLGAGWMGQRAGRLRHPMRAFAFVELGLAGVNGLIAILLSLDLASSLLAVPRLLVENGLSPRLFHAGGATVVLLPPTILMGATLPLASEAFQRQLGESQNRLIAVLFLLNTLGAMLGAFGSSFLLLPWLGQWSTLLVAVGMNALAAALLLWWSRALAPFPERDVATRDVGLRSAPLRLDEILGFFLGALSLGYEMFLLRLVALVHEPLPTTFATTLCLYLLFWSLGVYLASFFRERLHVTLAWVAFAIACVPALYAYDRFEADLALVGPGLAYFVPCIGFGLLYGALASRSARSWGRDVGRFYLLNTIGSCLGTLFFTLVGYELPLAWNAWIISIGLVGLLGVVLASEAETPSRLVWLARAGTAVGLVAIVGLTWVGFGTRFTEERGGRTYWGRDGVAEVRSEGHVYLDGLWHTKLSDGQSHIGDPYSWLMAVSAVAGHSDAPIRRALVVGNGVGVTASTLSRLTDVEIVAYEINHTLKDVLEDHRPGSLAILDNPKVEIRWQDARVGLGLDESRFDVIVSAPLYLRQAGSTLLLSTEYLALLADRLEPGGVLALYARDRSPTQATLVHQTLASVFPHVTTLYGGHIALASRSPIEIAPRRIRARVSAHPELLSEVRQFVARLRQRGQTLFGLLGPREIVARPGWPVIRDDRPLVEHPWMVRRLLGGIE